jgi:archaemetzincin
MKLIIILILLSLNVYSQVVKLIPINGFSQSITEYTKQEIEKYYNIKVVIGQNYTLKQSWYIKERSRYIADSILNNLIYLSRNNIFIVGLTDMDICTESNGNKAWGIFGLSYLDGNASVISNHRLKYNYSFINTVLHELGHMFSLDHCPNKKCIMHEWDASIKDWSENDYMCDKCKSLIKIKTK